MMKKWMYLTLPALLIYSADRPLPADDIAFSLLQGLVDESDLVIVATPQEVTGGAFGETVGQPGQMVEFMNMAPLLKINRLVKSDGFSAKTLRIHFTTRRFAGNLPPPDKVKNHLTTFNWADSAKDDKSLPGSPAKGVQYVFFLENGKKRHPESHFRAGKDELVYWTFDYDFDMIATTPALLSKLEKVSVDQSRK
jgi:hypothetical protein